MIQCAVVCCGVLRRVTVRYSVLQCAEVCCSVLQCAAVCCSVLQCLATSVSSTVTTHATPSTISSVIQSKSPIPFSLVFFQQNAAKETYRTGSSIEIWDWRNHTPNAGGFVYSCELKLQKFFVACTPFLKISCTVIRHGKCGRELTFENLDLSSSKGALPPSTETALHRYEWVMSHMDELCRRHEWVTSHLWMRHVTLINEPCHTYEWVVSHI